MSVDFPAPDGPMIDTNELLGMEKDTSFSTGVSPIATSLKWAETRERTSIMSLESLRISLAALGEQRRPHKAIHNEHDDEDSKHAGD
jgi:hypothetical protein